MLTPEPGGKEEAALAAIVDAVVKIIVLPTIGSEGTWGRLDKLS